VEEVAAEGVRTDSSSKVAVELHRYAFPYGGLLLHRAQPVERYTLDGGDGTPATCRGPFHAASGETFFLHGAATPL